MIRTRLLLLGILALLCPAYSKAGQALQSKGVRGLEHGEYTVELNGMQLWYKVSGSGPVCLMPTPPWGVPSDPYIRTLGSMEKLFTIVYLDSRGTGRSGRAQTLKEYTWDDLVGDLEALRAHLKQQETWLMGHSEGGVQVLQYAIKHPNRVKGMVLLTSEAVMDDAVFADIRRRQLLRLGQPWYESAAKAFENETPPATDEAFAENLKAALPLYWSDPAKIEPFQDDFAAALPSAQAAVASYESGRYPFDLRDQLKSMTAPALIVVGDDDIVCSPEAAITLHLALPNSKLLLIEDCGHFPWMEQPEVFEKKVSQFLRSMGVAHE
jgi:proline iminopeptidase